MINYNRHPSSFKDPAGFIFQAEGITYRQVNQSYAAAYDRLMSSGLYQQLVNKQQLIDHREIPDNITQMPEWYKTLQPAAVPFITYPYEWSFDQLRDAALLTLDIQQTALNHGMTLKDATPFNIQFIEGRPVFIDTLSFESYDHTKPWVAYRQFCQCFLFPLYLEHYLKKTYRKYSVPTSMAFRLM
ncbi:hypothetical protein [Paraflavitalea speifideaquila]|uniref:hypothetical protein n=1 Tax=Paraflavitalea speifideaquila TaxID=3076558 RepID=UPI0028ED9470|nr:hypothetical protein [Paraflavitalea speifideiaquila]